MTVSENTYTIILIAAIVILFTVYIVGLIKSLRAGSTGRRAAIPALTLAFLLLVYLAFNLREIVPADWAQIVLLFGLVVVTGVYALSTARQAEASVKMAEEMREQRYDAVRPVIDIQRQAPQEVRTVEVYAAIHEDTSRGLSCILHNIGLGPATDVYSFIQDSEQVRRRFNFGTLPIGGKTVLPMSLSLEQEDNRIALVAYYKDVYGRAFESSREVRADKEKHGWEIGPLQIRLVKEDKHND